MACQPISDLQTGLGPRGHVGDHEADGHEAGVEAEDAGVAHKLRGLPRVLVVRHQLVPAHHLQVGRLAEHPGVGVGVVVQLLAGDL